MRNLKENNKYFIESGSIIGTAGTVGNTPAINHNNNLYNTNRDYNGLARQVGQQQQQQQPPTAQLNNNNNKYDNDNLNDYDNTMPNSPTNGNGGLKRKHLDDGHLNNNNNNNKFKICNNEASEKLLKSNYDNYSRHYDDGEHQRIMNSSSAGGGGGAGDMSDYRTASDDPNGKLNDDNNSGDMRMNNYASSDELNQTTSEHGEKMGSGSEDEGNFTFSGASSNDIYLNFSFSPTSSKDQMIPVPRRNIAAIAPHSRHINCMNWNGPSRSPTTRTSTHVRSWQ